MLEICQDLLTDAYLFPYSYSPYSYEETHTVFTGYLRCDGVYRFLSARGNDRYGRIRSRANRVYESSFDVTDALAHEARLDFGL